MGRHTRIHVLTLRFDDHSLEAELRAGQLGASLYVLLITGGLCYAFLTATGYGQPFGDQPFGAKAFGPSHPYQMLQLLTVGVYLGFVRYLRPSDDDDAERGMRKHKIACHVWAGAWVTNIVAWWWAFMHDQVERFSPDEVEKINAASALWLTVPMVQHVLHIDPLHRACVICMALTIILSGQVCKPLLTALLAGEALGYAFEHNMRSAFLDRVETVRELRLTNERLMHDRAPDSNALDARISGAPSAPEAAQGFFPLRQQEGKREGEQEGQPGQPAQPGQPGQPGQSPSPPSKPPSPAAQQQQHIPPEEIVVQSIIGKGGMGLVYKGSWMGEVVALKVWRHVGDVHTLVRESQALARLRHPCVCRAYGTTQVEGRHTIVMEYSANGALDRWLLDLTSRGEVAPFPLICSIASQCASGLAYLHRQAVVHHDIKAGNILLDDRLNAKVADFGLSRFDAKPVATLDMLAKVAITTTPRDSAACAPGTFVGGSGEEGGTFVGRSGEEDDSFVWPATPPPDTREGTCSWSCSQRIGTLRYLAPEVLYKLRGTPESDVYAFGFLLWEMAHQMLAFAGIDAFKVATEITLRGERPPIALTGPRATLTSIIKACWQPIPEQRPTMQQCAESLSQLLGGASSHKVASYSSYSEADGVNNHANFSGGVPGGDTSAGASSGGASGGASSGGASGGASSGGASSGGPLSGGASSGGAPSGAPPGEARSKRSSWTSRLASWGQASASRHLRRRAGASQ